MTAFLAMIGTGDVMTWQEVCYRAIDIVYVIAIAWLSYKYGKRGTQQ